jgi:hypothetical protein
MHEIEKVSGSGSRALHEVEKVFRLWQQGMHDDLRKSQALAAGHA